MAPETVRLLEAAGEGRARPPVSAGRRGRGRGRVRELGSTVMAVMECGRERVGVRRAGELPGRRNEGLRAGLCVGLCVGLPRVRIPSPGTPGNREHKVRTQL